jgi:hypothetical protein
VKGVLLIIITLEGKMYVYRPVLGILECSAVSAMGKGCSLIESVLVFFLVLGSNPGLEHARHTL